MTLEIKQQQKYCIVVVLHDFYQKPVPFHQVVNRYVPDVLTEMNDVEHIAIKDCTYHFILSISKIAN